MEVRMNLRKLIRTILEDYVPPDETIDVNDDYAIVKKHGITRPNFFVYSKKEGKIVSSFFETLEGAREEALTRDAKKANLTIMNQHLPYIQQEVPDFFIQEGGIEEVIHFLAQEDGMNIRLHWTNDAISPERLRVNKNGEFYMKKDLVLPDFSQKPEPTSDNEIERILQANKVPYSLKDVRSRLAQYFMRRLVYNTPKDRVFASPEEALGFIKTYEQQFFYEYLRPMARIHKTKAGTSS